MRHKFECQPHVVGPEGMEILLNIGSTSRVGVPYGAISIADINFSDRTLNRFLYRTPLRDIVSFYWMFETNSLLVVREIE